VERKPVPVSSTEQISNDCDRIARECDTILISAYRVDLSIDRLQMSAGHMRAQMAYLDAEQSRVDLQRRQLSKKVFWANLRPSALLNRLSRSFAHTKPRIWPPTT